VLNSDDMAFIAYMLSDCMTYIMVRFSSLGEGQDIVICVTSLTALHQFRYGIGHYKGD
jgi:hypothetical protein